MIIYRKQDLTVTPAMWSKSIKHVRQLHVKLPRLQVMNTQKLSLNRGRKLKKTNFVAISLTPPVAHRVPSPSLNSRKNSLIPSVKMSKKSYFEHSFPDT